MSADRCMNYAPTYCTVLSAVILRRAPPLCTPESALPSRPLSLRMLRKEENAGRGLTASWRGVSAAQGWVGRVRGCQAACPGTCTHQIALVLMQCDLPFLALPTRLLSLPDLLKPLGSGLHFLTGELLNMS